MVFDGPGCGVRVFAVDLDGGPYARDVRLARTWDGDDWRWADDWRVVDGRVLRPGRLPVPRGEVPGSLELDARGLVVARVHDGRRVQVLRDADGGFRGMAAGSARVELDDVDGVPQARGRSASGRTVSYEKYGLQVRAVVADGRRTRYTYDGRALRSIAWDDGAAIRLDADGTSGHGGSWRCTRIGASARLSAPGGTSWALDPDGVTDPSGHRVVLHRDDGRLSGWTAPGGAQTLLARDAQGRVSSVRQDGRDLATLTHLDDRAQRLVVDGATWLLGRSDSGAVETVTDPTGRRVQRQTDALGRVQSVTRGAVVLLAARDSAGRVARLQTGTQSEVRVERDGHGGLTVVADAVGGTWRVSREHGRAVTVVDAAGGRWILRRDTLGRLVGVEAPDAQQGVVVRQGDDIVQVRGSTGGAWHFMRDGTGLLSGVRDPSGRTWGLARDPAGRLRSVRAPSGQATTLGFDPAGRVDRVADRAIRRARGWATEVQGLVRWRRDERGGTVAVDAGPVQFAVSRDAAGRVSEVTAGEQKWTLSRDASGALSGASGSDKLDIDRDAAGLVSRLVTGDTQLVFNRDMRGRVDVVRDGAATWDFARDSLGRLVRVEGPGGLTVGADYDRGGELSLLRLGNGTIIRRNVSPDAGELLATDARGENIGRAEWILDDAGRVTALGGEAPLSYERGADGALVAIVASDDGPVGAAWGWTGASVGGWDGVEARLDERGRPTELQLAPDGDRAWGLDAGKAAYAWDEAGRLVGLDGTAGTVRLSYDALGRLTRFAAGAHAVEVVRDALGRVARLGGARVVGWDGLLAVGEQVRAPMSRHAVARPGGAVMLDPRGYPLLAPWVGVLRAWPGGLVPGVDAAETGAGGRLALPWSGPLVGLVDAVDPVSGACLACAPAWPWAARATELGAAPSPTAAPDSASPAEWDPSPWDGPRGWDDPLARLAEVGLVPAGSAEPTSPPGLPWLPSSFAPVPPAPVAGLGAIELDEDPVGTLVLACALGGEPLTLDALLRAEVGAELAAATQLPPGLGPPLPGFVVAPLAAEPLRH